MGTTDKYTQEKKTKAALALNFCTVSVSQIVSYNDIYVLEQEYEAILNNLNLKAIPKDEALLKIITDILDTISYLRIQNIKKQRIEKRYQQRIKEAIWSAIPSMNIFMSGNPLTVVYSLATTVGTGYMNYRKQKAEILDGKEEELLDLKIEEIEVFDSLKHELFKTAWKMADEYDFDDKLRLTENQIEQYNRILVDNDELRKYERMDAIKDYFEAYPTFWYFFGHTAAVLCDSMVDADLKRHYRESALSHFEHYDELRKCNILRNDQITASFALEYVELLLQGEADRTKIIELLRLAESNAIGCFDIMQICAVEYLKLGDYDNACRLLKVLVNEDYNKIINAQILSSVYVGKNNASEYNILAMKVPEQYLYPMSSGDSSEIEFLNNQKDILKAEFKLFLRSLVKKYTIELNKSISSFDETAEYGEQFYENNESAKNGRLNVLRVLTFDKVKLDNYNEHLKSVSLPIKYIEVFKEIYNVLFGMTCMSDTEVQDKAISLTTKAIINNKDVINKIQDKINDGSFGEKEYRQLQTIGVSTFLNESFTVMLLHVSGLIDNSDKQGVVDIESDLLKACEKMNLPSVEIFSEEERHIESNVPSSDLFDVALFGSDAIVAQRNKEFSRDMLKDIKQNLDSISDGTNIQIIYRDSQQYDGYFYRLKQDEPFLKRETLAILVDKLDTKADLLFTRKGIAYVEKERNKAYCRYSDVRYANGHIEIGGSTYKGKSVDGGFIFEVCKNLDRKYINNLDKKIEYYEYVDGNILNEWFKTNSIAMMGDSISKMYAWPEKEVLERIGYSAEQYFDKNTHVMQFYFDNNKHQLLNIRIVEFERVADSFRKILDEHGGCVSVE